MEFENWIVGFVEAEGSFCHHKKIYPQFSLTQGEDSILFNIKDFFNKGTVSFKSGKGVWQYRVYGGNCWVLRDFFENRLLTDKKRRQFAAWKALNWRYLEDNPREKSYNPIGFEDWLIGFIEGEGSFTKLGNGKYPEFSISQDEKKILEKIQNFFGIGKIALTGNKRAWQLRITGKKKCKVVRDFCEGKLQMKTRVRQFENWKKLF